MRKGPEPFPPLISWVMGILAIALFVYVMIEGPIALSYLVCNPSNHCTVKVVR